MIFDNATTYVAGSKVIENLSNAPSVLQNLKHCGTTWKFNPNRALWFDC